MQRMWLKRGSYPVPKLRVLRRPTAEARDSLGTSVTQTVCIIWPMAEEALFSSPTFPASVQHLDETQPFEIRPSAVGGGFATFAVRDIQPGERIMVDIPLIVKATDMLHMTSSDPNSNMTYEDGEDVEQAFESLLPEDQESLLALHEGDAPGARVDLKSFLSAIIQINQYGIGEMPGGDENVVYGCIGKNLSRVNHRCVHPSLEICLQGPLLTSFPSAVHQMRHGDLIFRLSLFSFERQCGLSRKAKR